MSLYPILHVDKPLTRKERSDFDERALEVAKTWGRFYIVDRVGLKQGEPNIDVYQDLAREGEMWLDVGPAQAEDVMDSIVGGADRVTVRWDKIWDRPTLDDATDIAEDGVFVGLPFRENWIENRREGEPPIRELADHLAQLDVGGLVFIDLDRAGTSDGFRDTRCPDPERLGVPVWVAGGIKGPREAKKLVSKGFEGVLVGTSLDEFVAGEWT